MTNDAKLSMTLLNGDYKAISWCTEKEEFREELFNLTDDPGETRNLMGIDEYADVAFDMFALLSEMTDGDPCTAIESAIEGGSMTDVDDETLEALRSLGYIQ